MAILNLSPNEQWAVIVITGLTNIAAIPGIVYLTKTQSSLHGFIGWFAVFVSVCYHVAEALPSQKLFDVREGSWHRLDNIGCISAFNILAIYLLDIGNTHPKFRTFLEHFQFGLVMILQEWKPWDMRVTLIPIVFFNALVVIKYVILRYPLNWNFDKLKIAAIPMIPAIFCFFKGLDDRNDYLRMWHGMWHCLGGIATYWLWQIIPKNDKNIKMQNKKGSTRHKSQNNMHFGNHQQSMEKDGLKVG